MYQRVKYCILTYAKCLFKFLTGPHSAVYKVKETPVGIEFKKQRKGHVIPNAKGTLTKVKQINNKHTFLNEQFELTRQMHSMIFRLLSSAIKTETEMRLFF